MKKLRKFLTVGVMVLSIIAMSGLTVNTAKAAAQAGDLIKMDGLSSIYYLGNDGKRYVFPSESVYFSWYSDFSGVVTIPASELQSYPLGANVTMRPGTKLVKITTDPSVYAVTPNGVLRKIQSESDAITLYGTNWSKMVVDVADAFFTNYTIGTPLTSGQYPAGTLLKNANNASIYYFDGTNYRMIGSEAAFTANRFNFNNVVTTSMTLTASGNAISAKEDLSSPTGASNGQVVTGSGLTVALSSMTPAAASVPAGAAIVPFTTFNMTAASDGAVTVTSVTLTRTGVGEANDLSEVYLYDGDTRLTSSRTVSSSTNKVTFAGLNFMIPAGSTKQLTVRATIESGSSITLGNNAFGITAASDITSTGATVSGSFPVIGNTMSLTTGAAAGKIAYSLKSVADDSVKVGDKDVEVAKFQLNTTGSGEDVKVKNVTLVNNGSAKIADMSNFKIYRASDLVAATVTVINDKVMFVFDSPVTIEKGNSKTFSVKADIVSGATNNIKFEFDELTDIVAVGSTYGYNASVTASASAGDEISIDAGELTFEISGPASYDITKDMDNVNLADVKVVTNGTDPIDVKTMFGKITASSNGTTTIDQQIENVQLVNVTSNLYYDVTKVGTASSTEYIFKVTNFTIPAGNSTWRVEFDTVESKIVSGEKFVFSMFADDTTAAAAAPNGGANTGIDSRNSANKTITDINPGSLITGNNVTVTTAGLTISQKALANGNAVARTTGVKMIEFTAKAGNSSDVKLTEVDATLAGLKSNAANYTLWVDGNSTPLKSGVSASGGTPNTVTFSGLANGGLTIAKGETKSLYITSDISSSVTAANLVVSIASDGVKAEDPSNGNTVDVTASAMTGRTVSLVDHGTVKLTVDSSSMTADHIVMSGASDVEAFKMKADASDENVTVKTMKFQLPDNTSDSVAKVALYQTEGSNTRLVQEKTTFTTISGHDYVVFENLNTLSQPLVINKDTDSILTLKLSTTNIGTGANDTADSGDQITFTLSDNDTDVEAVGYSSNKDLVNADITAGTSDGSIVSKKQYVYANRLVATKTSDQPSNLLANGEKEILKFTLTPSGNNGKTAQLKEAKINVDLTGSAKIASGTDAITLWSGSTKVGTYTAAGNKTSDTYILTINSADDIASGGETYTVKVNFASVDADDVAAASIKVNRGAGNDDITWNDNKDASSTIAWIDLGEGVSTTTIDNSIKNK